MEDQICVAIHPRGSETRVLATAGGGSTLLKARLAARPWHQRALPSLLEALALWQSQPVRAVKHVLGLRAAEREDIERAIDIRGGKRQVLDIVLSAKPAPVLAPQPPPPAKTPEISLVTTESSPPKSRTLRIVTWSSLAGAVAAGAVAGVFLVILNSQHNDFQKYNDLYAQYGRAQDDTKRRSLSDDMTRSDRIAIGCGIGAGALAVTAVIAYLVDSRSKPGEGSVAVSPAGIGVRF